jgi:hypothetical protein
MKLLVPLKDPVYVGNVLSRSWSQFFQQIVDILNTEQDVIIDLATKGIVFKDSATPPHYWRITTNTVGALITTDLGTTRP